MEPDEIINFINQHREAILTELGRGNHFASYLLIQRKFLERKIDEEFESTFCRFYILNGPTGFNEAQKMRFFEILMSAQDDLSSLLKELYEIPGHQARRSLFLSFSTKLLHTLDNSLPIYDRNIATVLALTPTQQTGALEERVRNRVQIYDELKSKFGNLLVRVDVRDYLKSIRRELPEECNTISDVKLLDSILWAAYSVRN